MRDLEADYSPRSTVSIEEFDGIMDRQVAETHRATAGLNGFQGIAFDDRSDERLDVWGIADDQLRPAVLSIHGGYWRARSRRDAGFMARVLAVEGIATIPVDYGLAPAVSLEEIVRQIRAAVQWVHTSGREHGIDPTRLYAVGSSAGGHLAAMTAVQGWQEALGLPCVAVAGVMPISGLFDLRPLVALSPNDWLSLTPDRAAALSPMVLRATNVPACFVIAEREPDGFIRQTRDLSRLWRTHAHASLYTVPDRNHFDVFLDLGDPRSALSRALVDLVHSPTSGCG